MSQLPEFNPHPLLQGLRPLRNPPAVFQARREPAGHGGAGDARAATCCSPATKADAADDAARCWPPSGRILPPKAKHVIYLHMVGGPSQMDLYDYKPVMNEWFDKDLPDSIRMGQRLTTMTSRPDAVPDRAVEVQVRAARQVRHVGQRAAAVDGEDGRRHVLHPLMHTEAINHEPAITYMQTGNQITGRPCLGAWVSYGLGSLNENLPTFVVLVAKPTNTEQVQAISARLWSSGYLPGEHAGVSFRTAGDPILLHQQPAGRARRGPPQDARRPEGAQRDELSARSAIRRRTRASSSTNWPSACRPACRN